MKFTQVPILALMLVFAVSLFPSQADAQACSCNFAQTLMPSGSWANDFNCYQYVRAYYKESRYGQWIPPSTNNIAATYSSASLLGDPDFEVVTDLSQANAVYYPCQHAAVILMQGCLVEKVGYGSELRKHGINNGSCGPPTGATFLRYKNRSGVGVDQSCLPTPPPPPPTPANCTISGVWTNTGVSLSTFNYTSSYYNQVTVNCSTATSFTWSVINGSTLFQGCSNSNCSTAYFYLNVGQSVTFRVRAMNGTTQVGVKDYTFYRTSGGYLQAEEPNPESLGTQVASLSPDSPQLIVYPNPSSHDLYIHAPALDELTLEVRDLTGRTVNTGIQRTAAEAAHLDTSNLPNGIFFLRVYDKTGQLLVTEKFVVSK